MIESIDDRLRTSEEVESASMLPSLAAIPHLAPGPGWKKGEGKEEAAPGSPQALQQLIALWDPKSNGAEAYRSMRSALLLSSIDNPPRIIVVTSSFPSEGKTTTALNLAIVLAQRGERVLLVDADLRRGSLYHVFGLPSQGFGLSTVLTQVRRNIRTCQRRSPNCRRCTFCRRARGRRIRQRCFPPIAWRSRCGCGRSSSTGS